MCDPKVMLQRRAGQCSSNTRKHQICIHWPLLFSWFRGIDGLGVDESCRFRSPKSVEKGDALLSQSKPKSAQYGDQLSVKVFSNYW